MKVPKPSTAIASSIIILVLLLVVPVGNSFASAGPASSYPHSQTFVWYFGYLGDTFQPVSNLGLSQSYLISEASALSGEVGGPAHLTIIHAVAEGSQKYISTNMIASEAQYVSSLKQYAGNVSGWIDLSVINLTSSPHTVYTEVNKMVNQIGVNAIWFDHAVAYYNAIGRIAFNGMMQNLHEDFPGVLFFLNVTDVKGRIEPLSNTDWSDYTYVLPSFARSNLKGLAGFVTEPAITRSYNKYFPGHVILHFDSTANAADEPMSKFSALSGKLEITLVCKLLRAGLDPIGKANGYNLLIPVVGANTYTKGNYEGRIYNSLSEGYGARNTLKSFLSDFSRCVS